jgi:flagellar capping protein FliD
MATTFITINTGQRLGQQLRSAVDQLQTAKQALAKLKAIMDTQVSVSDYSMVESQFGIQAGQGQTCYNLVAGINTDLGASVNVTELLAWCG